MSKPATIDDVLEEQREIKRMLAELALRMRPKSRARRKVEQARKKLLAVHHPDDLDRAAARKALSRYR